MSNLLTFLATVLCLVGVVNSGKIVIYWGTYNGEGSLKAACDTGNYGIVVLSFLDTFGNGSTPHLSLADHCNATNGSCVPIGEDVKHCQSNGIKVLLSIGGAEGKYGIVSKDDATSVASYLWKNYLGGNSASRPLGSAVLDGIDFDIEIGGFEHYADLAQELKNQSKNILLSAAPQCPFPDAFVGPGNGSALSTGLFDYVFIQFYNNHDCQFRPKNKLKGVFKAWDQWVDISAGQIFFGLPASLSAATDEPSTKNGYMSSKILISEVLPRIKTSSKYGGVMLWSYYYDMVAHDGRKVPYSTTILRHV